MKVLLTVHQFFPEHTSGTEVLTLETARGLIAMGHQVKVLTGFYRHQPLQDFERFDRYEYDGIEVERFSFSPSPMGGEANLTRLEHDNPLFAQRFGELLDEYKPDVVHFFHLMRLSAAFIDQCELRAVPTVLTPTDFWFVCPFAQLMLPDHSACDGPDEGAIKCIRHFIQNNRSVSRLYAMAAHAPDSVLRLGLQAVRRNIHLRRGIPLGLAGIGENARALANRHPFLSGRLKRIDRVLVPNRFMWGVLSRHGLDPDKAVLQPFGINLDYQRNIPRIPSAKLRIGFIGTLAKHKGAHVLIEALRRLPDLDCEVRVYGRLTDDPAYGEFIQGLARDESRVKFMGGFPNSEIGQVFSELDVLVVPSIWLENTPLVIYSAQASGCPVIGSDVGGVASTVEDKVNGLLFPPGDADALARCISRLALEPGLLKRLGGAAKPPLSIRDYCEVLEQHYLQLAGIAS